MRRRTRTCHSVQRSQSVAMLGVAHYHPGEDAVRKSPWHAINQPVHHVCTNCPVAKGIEPQSRVEGTGSKPLCLDCEDLINQGAC